MNSGETTLGHSLCVSEMWSGEKGSGSDEEADEELPVPPFDELVSKLWNYQEVLLLLQDWQCQFEQI